MDDADIEQFFLGVSRRISLVNNRLRGHEPVGLAGRLPRSLKVCLLDDCRECGKRGGPRSRTRIIYLLPSQKNAVGGTKVSYQQSAAIARSGMQSFVFLAERPAFATTWFECDATMLRSGHVDPRTDFLIFSEVWAALATELCVPAGIKYAIFVQNGYITNNAAGYPQTVLRQSYEHASAILSISDDATAMIRIAFPFVPEEKMLRIVPSIPPFFKPGVKERLITYMPRKLPAHSQFLRFLLESHVPSGWRVGAIQDLNERGVSDLLGRSSVFLSFSDMEGLGLPPLEAALAGNIVVGYTGQAGREFFKAPIFREVAQGDFQTYLRLVLQATREIEAGRLADGDLLAQRQSLAETYSAIAEQASLAALVTRVNQIMPAHLATRAEPEEHAGNVAAASVGTK